MRGCGLARVSQFWRSEADLPDIGGGRIPQRVAFMIDRLGSILFVAALVFLAFVGGAMAVLGETFPHKYLRDAYLAGEALIAQRQETADPYVTDQWRKARDGEKGVTIHD